MKLFKSFFICSVLAADNRNTENKCDVNSLTPPANAKGWDCGGSEGSQFVVKGQKCYLNCADGFIKYSSRFLFIYSFPDNIFKPLDSNFIGAEEMAHGYCLESMNTCPL